MSGQDENERRALDAGTRASAPTSQTSQTERDLDRMLDMLTPPAPSDTLRARLKRDFEAGAAPARDDTAAGTNRWWTPFGNRIGGVAVAAALLLAVALGVLAPPVPREHPVVQPVASERTAVAIDDEGFADAELLARSAPDSALYMVATFNSNVSGSRGTEDAIAPGTYVGTAVDDADGGDIFSVMPLE